MRVSLALASALLISLAHSVKADTQEKSSLPSAGSENFYKGKAEGWFWYKDPPEELPEEPLKPPPPSSASPRS